MEYPLAYFITFTCYGTWLRGDERGSIDRIRNIPGTPFIPPSVGWVVTTRTKMKCPPYELDARRRETVLNSMLEVCGTRGYLMLATHVRTNHAHAVVQSLDDPDNVMNTFKRYASRHLNDAGLESRDRKRWTRHGSTQFLWKERDVQGAVHYVVYQQGEPMQVFLAGNPDPFGSHKPVRAANVRERLP